VNLAIAILIVAGATAAAVAAMLLVRRRAPEGSYFQDGDRAAGVFGVLAAGFAILLGFVIFLAFERYDAARSGTEAEALLLVQQFETAQFLPEGSRERLSGELVCYARWVVHKEWPDMEAGRTDLINPWSISLFRTIRTTDPKSVPEQTAYAKWLDQTSDREVARRDRTHGAAGVIPSSLWIVMLFAAGVIFAFLLFFADPAEGRVTQGMLMGSVASVITAMLLLLGFLDNPYRSGPGSLRPVAMERTLDALQEAGAAIGVTAPAPCTSEGLEP
jgi:Protein of unknown function (DUF4239)